MHITDWCVVGVLCSLSMLVGLLFSRRSSKHGAEGYFTGNRGLPWWAIGLSNTATYSSGTGGFVMLVLLNGLAGNWFWWASWIIWMPLVAVIWARLWRRMQIVTSAELISLRYGGGPAQLARKAYAFVCCFGFAVLLIGYITGFLVKTLEPVIKLEAWQILLIFGGITLAYTMFGGLLGVVYVDVVQFAILLVGTFTFFLLAVNQHGGWGAILDRVAVVHPGGLTQTPPTRGLDTLSVIVLVLQGLFFAGSPTAGEGMTAQRFMSARSERHAIGGQLFNAFLALSLRTIALIGLGVVAMSLFWAPDLERSLGPAPAGVSMLKDGAHAWGELVNRCRLPLGFVGLLVAIEIVAFMNALSGLLNWGSSFVVNDLLPAQSSPRRQVLLGRATTLVLFALAAAVTMLFVNNMMSWFLFINSVMVIFLLPLCWFRFFWWRFNVWGELAAMILGLPLSILVWFVLDFQNKPLWQGLGMLFGLSFVVLFAVTLLTPPESRETLVRFYKRCRPPGLWGPIRDSGGIPAVSEPQRSSDPTTGKLIIDCLLGVLACLGLVLATNAVFVLDWPRAAAGIAAAVIFGAWMIGRVFQAEPVSPVPETPVAVPVGATSQWQEPERP